MHFHRQVSFFHGYKFGAWSEFHPSFFPSKNIDSARSIRHTKNTADFEKFRGRTRLIGRAKKVFTSKSPCYRNL